MFGPKIAKKNELGTKRFNFLAWLLFPRHLGIRIAVAIGAEYVARIWPKMPIISSPNMVGLRTSIASGIPGAVDVKADYQGNIPTLTVRGCEKMGLAPSNVIDFPVFSVGGEVPVPIFSQPLRVKQEQLARYGVDAQLVMDTVASAGGYSVGEVFEGRMRFPLLVRFPEEWRDRVARLEQISVRVLEGMSRHEAAHEAASIRIRPVLMTALVASLGFLPMAASTTAGAEIQRPLASVVIGRLVTSTLLTALVIPAIYPWLTSDRPKNAV